VQIHGKTSSYTSYSTQSHIFSEDQEASLIAISLFYRAI
jgi:hypothetical protein